MQEFRAFELLRSGRDRSRYLLIKEAKIIAMTCTHAALKRRDLVEAGFQYDNILMEESAQILEIETFIPLLLQVWCHAVFSLYCSCWPHAVWELLISSKLFLWETTEPGFLLVLLFLLFCVMCFVVILFVFGC